MLSASTATIVGSVLGGLLGILLLAAFGVGLFAFFVVFKRKSQQSLDDDPVIAPMFAKYLEPDHLESDRKRRQETKELLKNPHEDINLPSKKGENMVATFFPCPTPTENTVLALHGLGNEGRKEFRFLAKHFLDQGYNVLLPDHIGHGRSDGNYIGFSVLENDNAVLWAKYLANRFPNGNIALFGISMGAASAMLTAAHSDLPTNVKLAISDCGFTSAREVIAEKAKTLLGLPSFPLVPIIRMWCRLIAGYDINKPRAVDAVKKSKVPVLFLHSEDDKVVPAWMGKACHAACVGEKELVLFQSAPHGQSYLVYETEYYGAVDQFVKKHFGELAAPAQPIPR